MNDGLKDTTGEARTPTMRPALDSSALMMAMIGEARSAALPEGPRSTGASSRVRRLRLVAIAVALTMTGIGGVAAHRARLPAAHAAAVVPVETPGEVAAQTPAISIEIDDSDFEIDEVTVQAKAPKAAALALAAPPVTPIVAQPVFGAVDTALVAGLGTKTAAASERGAALDLPAAAAVAPVAPVRVTAPRAPTAAKPETSVDPKSDLSWNKPSDAPVVEAVNPETLKSARREQSLVDLARRVRLSCGSIARSVPGGLSVKLRVSVAPSAEVSSAAAPGAPDALTQCMDRVARAHAFPPESAGKSFEIAFTWRSQ